MFSIVEKLSELGTDEERILFLENMFMELFLWLGKPEQGEVADKVFHFFNEKTKELDEIAEQVFTSND